MNIDQANKSDQGGDPPADQREFKRDFHKSWGIIIGIDHYTHGIPTLRTAINDARNLARILEEQHEYKVHLLIENVTNEHLQELLKHTLPNQVGTGDRVFFYFAGHGVALDGDSGPTGYLIPQDARQEDRSTYLSMHEVHEALTALPCRHLLAVLDCCFAGAFRWSSTRDVFPLPEVIHRERYERFIRDPAWQVITSAAYDQKALDIVAGDLYGERGEIQEHSPFALALFEALAGAGDVVPPDHGDGVITATELYLYLRDHVEVKSETQVGQRQTPSLWPLNKHDKGEYIFLVPGQEPNLPPAPPLTFENNPYRGLQSYDEQHNDLFFGRSTLIQQLVEQVEAHPLTVVLGASGTGKSSLVKAGLLPQLGGSHRPNDPGNSNEHWFVLPPIRLGRSPTRSLSTLLSVHLPDLVQLVSQEKLGTDPCALAVLAAEWGKCNPNCNLLLVIDQFEELVTICQDEIERTKFLNLLSVAIEAHPETVRVILTLRSDFEPQFANSSLQPDWSQARFLVPPMSQDDLRQVIEGPASVRVLYFEPYELVDDLINEVILTPGALPLLSFTLSELYVKYVESERDNRALTREDYKALDGVIGSLRNRASAEYEQLDQDHRRTMRRIMLRMVAVEGGELARRRVPRSELVYKNELENERVETVLNCLVNARLAVEGLDENGESFVEPAHDALVRAWDKLLEWRHLSEEELPLQRRVAQAARDWDITEDEGAKNSLLWNNNPRLPQLQQALLKERTFPSGVLGLVRRVRQALWPSHIEIDPNTWLNHLETDFVNSSVVRRARDLRRLVGVTLGVILVLSALTVVAILSRDAAIKSEETALAEAAIRGTAQAQEATARIEAEHSAATAIAEAQLRATAQAMEVIARVEAENSAATAIAEEQLRATAQQQESLARADAEQKAALAFSRELAARSNANLDNDLDLALLLAVEANQITDTLESQGSLLTGLSQSIYPLKYLHGHKGIVQDLAFNPDGTLLASSAFDKKVILWDVSSGHPLGQLMTNDQISGVPLSGHGYPVGSVAFSLDGKQIASSDGDKIYFWEIQSGEAIDVKHIGEFADPWGLDFSYDLRKFASSHSEMLTVWDISTGEVIFGPNPTEADLTRSVAFSPDGSKIAIAAEESRLIIWDIATGLPIVESDIDDVTTFDGIAFTSDGQTVALGTNSGTVMLFDTTSGALIDQLITGNDGLVKALAFDEKGEFLASADANGNVVLTDLAHPERFPKKIKVTFEQIHSLSMSANKKSLAVGLLDGTILIWDLSSTPAPGEVFWPELEVWFTKVTISPDGKLLAIGRDDGQIELLEIASKEPVLPLLSGHQDRIGSLAFDPTGQRLASGSWDGEILLWDVSTGKPQGESLSGHTDIVKSLTFSADGSTLISAAFNDGVIFWDLNTLAQVKKIDGRLAVLSPDGHTLAIDTFDGVILLDADSHQQIGQTLDAGTTFECIAFSPDSSMIATGDWSGQIAFWSAKTGQRLSELLPGHTSWVEEVAFSPDGKILASNGMDGMIIFWDVATQRKLSLGIDASSKGEYLAFSHDSHALFSDGRGGIVRWSLDYASMRDQACQIANRNLTQSEWDLYIGSNLSYQRTCPEIPLNDFDLQAMMLSDAELGQIAAGLDIAYLESGLMLNERFVRDSVDLSNSPDPIYQLGRLTGYRSDYHIPEYYTAVSNNYAGFLRVGTAISLFQDPQSVQLFKNHTFDQLERFNQGDPNLRCCLLDWEEISLDGIADDTWGILMRFDNPSNELIVTRTYISIQIGNLLGEVNIYRSDEVDDMPEVQRIARVLERKILQVLQNESDPRFMLLNPLSYGVNTP